jgi:hypothetical protein
VFPNKDEAFLDKELGRITGRCERKVDAERNKAPKVGGR